MNYHNIRRTHVDEKWIASKCLHHTKHKLWKDDAGHLDLINFEIAAEAQEHREEEPQLVTIEELEAPLIAELEADGSDDKIGCDSDDDVILQT